jgi:hypothetical protein
MAAASCVSEDVQPSHLGFERSLVLTRVRLEPAGIEESPDVPLLNIATTDGRWDAGAFKIVQD